jgi:Holliday junction DNA helicase RuvB
MIFSGFPGCGKTSMAKYLASKLKTDFISVVPESLSTQNKIRELFNKLNYIGYDARGNRISKITPSIIFLDECHRLPMFGQEKLGIAMENFTVDSGRPNKLFWLPYFTVIGATTLSGELSKPFLDRFKLSLFFNPYNDADSIKIVKYHANLLNVFITNKAAREIVKRGRGIPRILIRYLENCRDTMYSKNSVLINSFITDITFKLAEIDENGFNATELLILKSLHGQDKPLGLETLSVITGESPKTIKSDIETYLIRQEYMVRSGSGRIITQKGIDYIENNGAVETHFGRETITPNYVRS